jgi:hypothetical protein
MMLCIKSEDDGKCSIVRCMKHLREMLEMIVTERYGFRWNEMNSFGARQSMEIFPV